MNRGCPRRLLLAAAAAAPWVRAARAATAGKGLGSGDLFPAHATLMIAGPQGGRLAQLGHVLAQGMQAHLPAGTVLAEASVGGLDGVTGANAFDTSANLDGGTALLLPGAASLAWLAGDSRVHFDPSRWLPILLRTSPAVVVTRQGTALRPGETVRVASGGPIGPSLAAMLALDLLGAAVRPVYGLNDDAAALAAVAGGGADAALVRGWPTLAARVPALQARFGLGVPGPDGIFERDAAAPSVPTLVEYGAATGRAVPNGPRFAAWSGAAVAAQLQYALVLPSLTPASAVALWRDAGEAALTQDLASSFHVAYASAASTVLRLLSPGAAALLALRGWLADRLGWQPD